MRSKQFLIFVVALFALLSVRFLAANIAAQKPIASDDYNVIKGETILQFHGIGPYDINYVNPSDDPTLKASN